MERTVHSLIPSNPNSSGARLHSDVALLRRCFYSAAQDGEHLGMIFCFWPCNNHLQFWKRDKTVLSNNDILSDCAKNCSEKEEEVSIDCSSIFRLSSNDEVLRFPAQQLCGVNVTYGHREVEGHGQAGRALGSSHADPQTAWQVEDRAWLSALSPEKQYNRCLVFLSHSSCFPVQEEQVDSNTIYNALWEDCRRLLKTGTTDLLFPFHLQEYVHKR